MKLLKIKCSDADFECNECGLNFPTSERLKQHIKTFHEGKKVATTKTSSKEKENDPDQLIFGRKWSEIQRIQQGK